MHFPILALLAGALGRLGRQFCLRVDRIEREIAEYVLNFASIDVIADNLWVRLTDVLRAIRSLKI